MNTMIKLIACMSASAGALVAASAGAQTLSAQYYRVAVGTDADFPGGNPVVGMGSALVSGRPAGTGVADIVAGTNEITWWSPELNSHVAATGTGTITLPYGSNMFAPNSTGTNNNNFFETAVFSGVLTLVNAGSVQFTLGSDDDSFIYVDGVLFGQNPGIHGVSTVTFSTPSLSAGAHNLALFYADRQQSAAYLSLNIVTPGVAVGAVPEPATWAMMIAGFGMAGFAMRRRQRASVRVAYSA